MIATLEVGHLYKIEKVVTPELTAEYFGNPGVQVLATSALIGLLEETAIACMAPALTESRGSVGTQVGVQHLAGGKAND